MVDVVLDFGLAFCPAQPRTDEERYGIRERSAVIALMQTSHGLILRGEFSGDVPLDRNGFFRSEHAFVLEFVEPSLDQDRAKFWANGQLTPPNGDLVFTPLWLRYGATYSHIAEDGVDRGLELRRAFVAVVRAWKRRCLVNHDEAFVGRVLATWRETGRVRFLGRTRRR